jgi:hypothetical protein
MLSDSGQMVSDSHSVDRTFVQSVGCTSIVSYLGLRSCYSSGDYALVSHLGCLVLAKVRSCGTCGPSGTGAGFLRVLRFSLPLIPSTAPNSSSITRGWSNRPNIGRCTKWTQYHPIPPKKLIGSTFRIL